MGRQERKKATKSSPTKTKSLRKIATRIEGLDDILNGGLPAGRTTLVSGGPGCGKSILGMEFLWRGAVASEPGIFITFEERAKDVRQNALTLGWDFAPLEQAGKLFVMEARISPEALLSGDFNLKALFAIIEGKARAMKASRIVFDAIDVLLRLFDDMARERNELYALREWLSDREMTAVLSAKTSRDREMAARYEFLDFMVDCVIELDQHIVQQITTRRVRVLKYRGSDFHHNEYPFVITESGISIIPISKVWLGHKALGPKVSSGHPRLDTVLGGGYRRASSILISGSSGTGKTTLANTFARAACERGEKVLYINFEESEEAMVSGMLSSGTDLRPALKADTLRVQTAMPEAVGGEEHLLRAFKVISMFEPNHVVVDAISACTRMGSEQVAFEYIMRLIDACKTKGITVILLNQCEGFMETGEISGIGISSVVDAVISLRYIDIGGEINRMLLVMKARGCKHSNQYREFIITDDGIDLVDVYVGEGGVLTGAARQEQEVKEDTQHRLKQQEIKRKEKELKQMRAVMQAETVKQQAELAIAEASLDELKLTQDLLAKGRAIRGIMRGEDNDKEQYPPPQGRRGKGGSK